MNEKVSVVILNWNGAKLMQRFLPSVVAHTPRDIARVYVADNGSTDDSIPLLKKDFPEVGIITLDKNYGFAEGYNRVIKTIDTEYTLLLNSDVEVPDGWLEPLVNFMDNHLDYGACQPVIRSCENRDKFEYAGAAGGYLDRNGYPYCKGRIFAETEVDKGQYSADPYNDIFWASGAALMVRTDLYNRLGGLDSYFFAHMEEIDLCWRIWLDGYRIACVNSSHIFHLGGGSLPASNPKKTYLNFRNNLLMLHKNLPASERKGFLFRRRLLDTLAWLKFVMTLDFDNAKAIVRAHREFKMMRDNLYNNLPDPFENILMQLPQGRVNILIQHYLYGRKRYSDLIISGD